MVISQVQIAGNTADDEFIELYNPTNAVINLKNWKLTKKTSTGNESNLLTSFPDLSIPAHKYFLITPQNGYTGNILKDAVYSGSTYSIATDNTILLYDSEKISG